jgi:hypothetical protein
MKKKEFQDLK